MRPPKLAGALLLGLMTLFSNNASHAAEIPAGLTAKTGNPEALMRRAGAGESVRVTLMLRAAKPESRQNGKGLEMNSARSAARQAQDKFINGFFGGWKENSRALEWRKLHRFRTLPLISLLVRESDIGRLSSDENVEKIIVEKLHKLQLYESVRKINTPGLKASEKAGPRGVRPAANGRPRLEMNKKSPTGAGAMVVVVDTGVASDHPFLKDQVREEACFSTPFDEKNYETLCPNKKIKQLGKGAAKPCATGCSHGTHVAGIAAGKYLEADGLRGVAPEAKIFAIQVFQKKKGTNDVFSNTVDYKLALDLVLDKADSLKPRVAAVNMSLGGGYAETACDKDDPALAMLVEQLRAKGIATVIAAGNDSGWMSVSEPACVSKAVTVGSTTKFDRVAAYSNINPLVDLLAPGGADGSSLRSITSAVPGDGYENFSGTSMAAPHVAGAFALLRSAHPAATLDELETALKQTGVPVRDQRPGGTLILPRIDVGKALARLGGKDAPKTGVAATRPARTPAAVAGRPARAGVASQPRPRQPAGNHPTTRPTYTPSFGDNARPSAADQFNRALGN